MKKVDFKYFSAYKSSLISNNKTFDHFFSCKSGDFDKLKNIKKSFPSDHQFVYAQQSHSANCVEITQQNIHKFHKDTDAFITQVSKIILLIKTADCCPVFILDRKEQGIAAIHSGWRGTLANITKNTVKLMMQRFSSKPENLIALIGPCINQHNYPVGKELVDKFFDKNLEYQSYFNYKASTNEYYMNNPGLIKHQIQDCGISPNHIDLFEGCSFEMHNDFYSFRRDRTSTGRMVNGIFLK